MSFSDYAPVVLALPAVIHSSQSPTHVWRDIVTRISTFGPVPADISSANIETDIARAADQLRDVFAVSPPPSTLQLLYFGLFAAVNPDSLTEEAGYYVAGSTQSVPRVETAAELAGGVLDYEPDNPYLDCALLQRIKVAALANESDYDRYDYALMLGAASVISRFAVDRLAIRCRVVVGFDSGDAVELAQI